MIKLSNVSKTYTHHRISQEVLKNISLTLPDKGLITILGDSGSGKTTLLNCIGGLENFKGKITIDSFSFSKENKHLNAFRSKHIGYVFQDFCLNEDKTVLENIQQAIDIAKNNEENDSEKIKSILDFVGMKNYFNRKVSSLSGGQKQRVGIARALINDAKIILADEPTGHLDSENTKKIMEIFKKISFNALVVIVTHEKVIAESYSDRIIEISDGTISSDTNYITHNTQDSSRLSLIHTKKVKCKKKIEPFKYIFSFTKSRIAAIILFIFASIFVSLSMSFSVFNNEKDYSSYIYHPKNSIHVNANNGPFSEKDFNRILSVNNIKSILPSTALIPFEFTSSPLIQPSSSTIQILAYTCPIEGSKEIIYGSMPKEPFEIVIDEFLCNRLINKSSSQAESTKFFGFINPDNFLNTRIKFNNQYEFKIVGISKSYSPCLYFKENDLFSLLFKYELNAPDIYNDPVIINQSFLLEENEVVINRDEYLKGNYLENNNEIDILGTIYNIKDTYDSLTNNTIFMNLVEMKDLYWNHYLEYKDDLFFLCDNPSIAKEEVSTLGYSCFTAEESAKFRYLEENMQGQRVSNLFAILISVAAGFIYLLSEKKKINEISGDISIKRLLGQSKYKILFHLLLESFMTILVFASPFYLLSSLVINGAAVSLGSVISINQIPIGKLFFGLFLLFLISTLITFIISIPLIRNSPASLNKAKE